MRENKVKRILKDGNVSVGTMVFEFNTTGIGRIAAAAGADFAVFDMEHTGWSMETIRMLMATCPRDGLVPLVRVPAITYHFMARSLDAGAMGLMVPMVQNGEQARSIVQAAKYPPIGSRGAAFGIAHDDYGDGDVAGKMERANREVLLIAQIETVEGVQNVDEIAGTDGIDVLWIGHFDLTNSLGIPAQFTHAEYQKAVDRVLEACQKHGKAPGIMVSSPDESRVMLDQGFRCLAYWGDLWVYRQALREGIDAVRAASETRE
ncbi:MAG: aldolase/citrate lyase family protein [bacterium]|nr:aldolase/citrate lyase family protein [bacterium]